MGFNGMFSIVTEESSREYLSKKLDWILDLMDKEHHNASTHSQRNAYQAVIRHELEIMRDELRYSRSSDGKEDPNAIPF